MHSLRPSEPRPSERRRSEPVSPVRQHAALRTGASGPGLPRRPALEIPVIAHRGASDDVPEHTLAAYEAALLQGADGLECDVRLTADMQLVCVHDRRVNRTSNGRGVVSTLELAQLRQLDFGSWKQPAAGEEHEYAEYPDLRREGAHRVLTLERLLQLVVEHPHRVEMAIETKHPTRYAGLVEEHLVALLDRFGLAHPRLGETSPVRVMSFSAMSVRRIRRLAPSLDTVLLLDRVPLRLRDGSLPRGVRIAGPGIHILRIHPEYVERVHSMGNRVHVWTVDQPSDIDLCVELGVDAIISNRPKAVLARLGRDGTAAAAAARHGVVELNPDSP
ncbi:Glycerophosphodiester phosphodiesterase [Catenulispora acidiphila DSM 44928]|uniref:Glycerophosphodiester phosphodiesterase n=1 Tax=Catenulispora acidiphila (strain DSM 44928 / JCM 14897 / NBRC 102108 / NRRL B-24433 / ID139908) TaxID=479433 RepID=C7QJ48_CATAD|nr:glycerophosphodiester phosphodiesterase [Catenulispora acidiphila]ACU69190.1 Glycerophosphodiester phosphodiesterase [Catenulispora acidiphila DSM 44928]